MKLLSAIAASVGHTYNEMHVASAAGMRAVCGKPVLQFSSFPIKVDIDRYKNPCSDLNPDGDLEALFAFRQLVDPVPNFRPFYTPSRTSTEAVYRHIIQEASVIASGSLSADVINDAKKQFDESCVEEMDGTSGKWRPVYAMPGDWYETSQNERFRYIDTDLDEEDEDDCPFTLIGHQQDLRLSVEGLLAGSLDLDPETRLETLKMKYLLVTLRRPWLNPLLFESDDWYLSGQPKGFCSSGKSDYNPGVFPLLLTGVLFAKDVSVGVEWGEKDQPIVDIAESSDNTVTLGPLALSSDSESSDSTLQIIGWISTLVPFSPRSEELKAMSGS